MIYYYLFYYNGFREGGPSLKGCYLDVLLGLALKDCYNELIYS